MSTNINNQESGTYLSPLGRKRPPRTIPGLVGNIHQAVQRQQRRGAEVLGMKTPAQLVFGLWKHQRLYDQALGFLERVLPLLRAAILPQPTRRAQT